MSTANPPDHDELTRCLDANESDMGASECHGIVTALLLCQNPLDTATWSRRILSGELESDPSEGGAAIPHPDDMALVGRLMDETRERLDDPELGFAPLLPDEEASIEERSAALREWVQGFLYGLGLGGLKEFDQLSEQAREFSRDLLQIGNLEVADEESEESEKALFEIVEYVRMGVLVLRDELSPLARTEPADRATLH